MDDFNDQRVLIDYLRGELTGRGYQEELVAELIEEVAGACEVDVHTGRPDEHPLAGPGGRWVIRTEHWNALDILDDIVKGVGTTTLAGFFFPEVALPFPVLPALGIGISAVRAVARFRRKVIDLTQRQAQVILTLKHAPLPVAVGELSVALNNAYGRPGRDQTAWSKEKTLETLQSLEKVKTRSGNTEALVASDEQGKWRVVGI